MLAPLFFAHFLRLRYYLSPPTRQAFAWVSAQIDHGLAHPSVPAPVKKGVTTVRDLVSHSCPPYATRHPTTVRWRVAVKCVWDAQLTKDRVECRLSVTRSLLSLSAVSPERLGLPLRPPERGRLRRALLAERSLVWRVSV